MRKKAMKYVSQVTELSTEKVELGVDDYDKFRKQALTDFRKIKELAGEYASISKQLLSIRKRASQLSFDSSSIQKEATAQANKDVKAARELGVDPSIVTKPYNDLMKETDENIKMSERIIQQIGKVR
tara:strand:+ start:26 stop:406 length:381 start_codon:yes stop_codon:yes gene_type:complete